MRIMRPPRSSFCPESLSPSQMIRELSRQQQKAEGRALVPVEAGDELVVDLLGEPEGVLAAHQVGGEVVAEGEHEDDDGAGGDAGLAVGEDDPPPDGQLAGAQVVGGLDQAVVEALHHR